MRLKIVFSLCLITILHLTTVNTAAQPNTAHAKIDAFVQERMATLDIPGAALAVVQGEEIVYLQGYGVANVAGDPVTPQTPFLLASLTKSMTAVAIMQLVEGKQIDLDAPIQQYLPWFMPEAPITVRQLLYQTSGLDEGQGSARNFEPDDADALERSIRQLSEAELNRPPGSVFEYSNSNYDVLGLLVEKVSGQSYSDYMRTNLFEPLQMTDTVTDLETARAAGMSSAFYPFFGRRTAVDAILPYSRATHPSTGVIGSVEDMAHYLIAHLNEGGYQNTRILTPDSIEMLHTPGVATGPEAGATEYAMGWAVWTFDDALPDETAVPPTALSHGGDWLGFLHIMLLIPEKDFGVVLLLNNKDPVLSSAYSNIAFDVTLLALGLEAQHYPVQEDVLTRYLRPLSFALILLLLSSALLTRRRLNRTLFTTRDGWIYIGLALIDLTLIFYSLLIRLPNNESSVRQVLRFEPDLGMMLLIILLLTAVWGSIRSLWALQRWQGSKK